MRATVGGVPPHRQGPDPGNPMLPSPGTAARLAAIG
jgi:hypothetical protein